MTYEELQRILRMNRVGQSAPTGLNIDQIISGIQNQYQPSQQQFFNQDQPRFEQFQRSTEPYNFPTANVPQFNSNMNYGVMPVNSMGQGAQRFIDPNAVMAQQQAPFIEYGNQVNTFTPSAFDIEKYRYKEPETITDVVNIIGSDGSGGGTGDNSNSGLSIDSDTGLASSVNVSPGMVTAGLMAAGMLGVPGTGLVNLGKNAIASGMSEASYNAAVAHNNAVVAASMGLDPSDPANAAAISSGIDSLSSAPTGQSSATSGPSGTGGAAAQAAADAAAAAAAMGLSDAAIGAAAQAAADAALGGTNATTSSAANPADFGGYSGYGGSDGGVGGVGGAGGPGSTSAANASDFGGMDSSSDSGGGGGSGSGGCVIATHAVAHGSFTKREKQKAVVWCVKTLHNSWWGEAIRRGYRFHGNKAIRAGKAHEYYEEFRDFVRFATGTKRNAKTAKTFAFRSVQFFFTGLFVKEKV